MKQKKQADAVCFGEVLWDILPAGAVPGGAPVNVAYHLGKQGIHAAVITRVGNDDSGRKLTGIFDNKGVDTSWFQVDDKVETGKVCALPQANHDVKYEFLQPSAWDRIEYLDEHATLIENASCFIYGTLALREQQSRNTLFRLLKKATRKIFDVNLREGYYTKDLLLQLLEEADMVKMNTDELTLINGWLNGRSGVEEQLRFIARKFNLVTVVVTLGADGAVMLHNEEVFSVPGIHVPVEDTVGSGDAFLARLIAGMLSGAAPLEALTAANALGAFIASKRGACPDYVVEGPVIR
ncbi:MAG: carbohydrate kinase [Chitinophagaceae bacterium]|nr:MAG: carbohydrate kinase [Chitinophagaceae bacterium]